MNDYNEVNLQFTKTNYRLRNQMDLDILAEYLGEHAERFTFQTTKAVRALFTTKVTSIGDKKHNAFAYLDLIDKKSVRFSYQIDDKSQVIRSWSLEDPDGIDEVREAVRCAIYLLTRVKEEKPESELICD